MNDTDPPIALPDDQCVLAQNVEFTTSTCGERRNGSTAVDITGANLTSAVAVLFLHRHLPTSDETAAELFAFGVSAGLTPYLSRKNTAWHDVTMADAVVFSSARGFEMSAVTLHAKMFLAYGSATNRLHVWDGTSLRRVGMAAPTAAPTTAETGSAGSFTGNRIYRTREVVKSGSTVLRRSEPSPESATFVPSGTKTGAVVTKPADMGESATHWELEAALVSAPGDWYVIASTLVGTTTANDTNANYSAFEVSPDIGDYLPPHSPQFVIADEDRLVMGGSFNDAALASRVAWTPVYNDPGDGNDERIPIDTTNYVDLDTYDGGELTGLIGPVNGAIWAFKRSRIYKLVRTNDADRAYNVIATSKQRGALRGSVVEGVDQTGRPCVYFLDPAAGPCRLGANGLQDCGADIVGTWSTVDTTATSNYTSAIFYPEKRQVHWSVLTSVDLVGIPARLVLHCKHMRDTIDGVRGGHAVWTTTQPIHAMCLFADNIDDDAARSVVLRPFLGATSSDPIWRGDTGDDDNGTAYTATITTKAYTPSILDHFEVRSAAVLATAATGVSVSVSVTKDFGLETTVPVDVDCSPVDAEAYVIRPIDNLGIGELTAVQFTVSDPATPTGRWELQQIAVSSTRGMTS